MQAQGTQFQVNTYTAGAQFGPAVAMDSSGDFVITWTSNGEDGNSYGVFGQQYNASGTNSQVVATYGSEFQVNTYTSNNQGNPAVAMSSSGAFVVAWQSYKQDGDEYGVYVQQYNAGGVGRGASSGSIPTPPATRNARRWACRGRRLVRRLRRRLGELRRGRQRLRHLCSALQLQRRDPGERVPGQHLHDGRSVRPLGGHGFRRRPGHRLAERLLRKAYARRRWRAEDGSGNGVYAKQYPVYKPPVVATNAGALTYTSGSGAVRVDSFATITDNESATITSATVTITSGYFSGEDLLGFTTQGNISGSFSAATGTLTLSGIGTLLQYQTALRGHLRPGQRQHLGAEHHRQRHGQRRPVSERAGQVARRISPRPRAEPSSKSTPTRRMTRSIRRWPRTPRGRLCHRLGGPT